MAPDDTETVTFRIPKDLKDRVEAAAGAEGATLTAFLRQALQDRVAPRGPSYQVPGFTPEMQTFVDKYLESKNIVVLMVEQRNGARCFYEGSIVPRFTNTSLIALHRNRARPWLVFRRDIVGWFSGRDRERNDLAMALREQGWAPMSHESELY